MVSTFNFSCSPIFLLLGLLLTGCVTTEEEMAEGRALDQAAFGRADHDGDGKVSKSELARHMHREALAEFDLNNDNFISNEEWRVTHQNPELTDEHFNRLDKDGDGRVGEDEAVKFITEHVSFGDAFKELDQNGDLHLHWEEYADGEEGILNISLFSIPTN